MNIWAWVRETKLRLAQGDPQAQRLAELMRDLPSAAVDESHERVDGMVPEALALARDLDEPWVEVFVRHWSLQSRVLHRRRAVEELGEAVALLDFANGPRTSSCPQSVCAVQDLAVCYAIRDGPGYVAERLAVARETLTRIDPGWGCFDCISGEYFSALLDDARPAEALAFIEGQISQAAEHGEFEVGFNTRLNQARALAKLGRADEGLALLDAVHDVPRYGRSRVMTHRQARIGMLIQLSRAAEALDLHPPLSAVLETGGHLRDWVDNLAGLVDAGAIANSVQVGRELLTVQERFVSHQAIWDTACTALIGARLAAARGARVVAQLALADADAAMAKLRRPDRLADRRAAAAAALAALPTLGEDAESNTDTEDPERVLDRLQARSETGSETGEAVLARAAALRTIGRVELARELLTRHAHSPDGAGAASPALTLELAATLLAAHDHEALDRLVETNPRDANPDLALRLAWIHGQSLRNRGRLAELLERDRALVDHGGGAAPIPFWLRIAEVARARGEWSLALDALTAAAESLAPGPVDWDRITAATVLGRWADVRAAGSRLGLSLPGEGDEPIELKLGLVRCEFVEASGRRERYWALRSSPCAARIIEIAMPDDPQHYGDQVVFEPSDLDGHLREGNDDHRPCFEVVAVLDPGGHRSFLFRGHDPGAEVIEALRTELRDAGFGFERITREGREAQDPRVEEGSEASPRPTVALLVALPPGRDAAELREHVGGSTADWELPLLCPELDDAAGETEAAAEARALVQRWKP